MNCESANRCYSYREWAFAGPRDAIRLLKRDRRKHRNLAGLQRLHINTEYYIYVFQQSHQEAYKKVYTCSP